ncbi:MAG TPA: hypothetical protein VJI75_06565 [Candidatus Nanoarchaeia archaeon]|nr:hypothetical protein [Candidatus Nanoarchaeia archaeon]
MSLCELINRLEAGAPAADDLGHPLALAVVAELGQCEKSEEQRKLFGDCRVLADHIIESYVRLDRQDKLKMAEVYQQEGCFREICAIGYLQKNRLINVLGESNLHLLLWISNYSKFIPVLEKYVFFVESLSDVHLRRDVSLRWYFRTHSLDGGCVNSINDSLNTFLTYDLSSFKGKMQCGEKAVLKSVLFGVNSNLQKEILNARSLLYLRKQILSNYVNWIESSNYLSPGRVSFGRYLRNHNLNGEETSFRRSDSLRAFSLYDFRAYKGKLRGGDEAILDSILYGVDDDLRERVLDACSLLALRKKILNNYVTHIEDDARSLDRISLREYLSTFCFGGTLVKPDINVSLCAFAGYDFRTQKSRMHGGNVAVVESMLYRVTDQDLITKVRSYNLRKASSKD